jgi:putative GTP pyrophosphokinase
MIDTEEARKRWLSERAGHDDFAKLVASRVKVAVQAKGIWSDTSGRAKEVYSLVKKLLKGKHSYDSLPDKAGARCVVRYLSDLQKTVSIAQELLDCSPADDKLKEREDNQVGYISIHLEVRLKAGDPDVAKFPPNQFWAELQIRTLGQHLWAEMAHDTVYKNDDELSQLPPEIKRRVNLMAGLIEVADHEFERLNTELVLDPAIQVYKTLEPYYYRLTSERPDTGLSLSVINLLMPLYENNVTVISDLVGDYFEKHRQELAFAYENPDELKISAFFYQPIVFMILERLQNDEFALRREWNRHFPEQELERVATAFGVSLED